MAAVRRHLAWRDISPNKFYQTVVTRLDMMEADGHIKTVRRDPGPRGSRRAEAATCSVGRTRSHLRALPALAGAGEAHHQRGFELTTASTSRSRPTIPGGPRQDHTGLHLDECVLVGRPRSPDPETYRAAARHGDAAGVDADRHQYRLPAARVAYDRWRGTSARRQGAGHPGAVAKLNPATSAGRDRRRDGRGPACGGRGLF